MMNNNFNKINQARISDIKDRNVRNMIRGIINEKNHYKINKSLDRIKQMYGENLYIKSLDVIRGNKLFKDNEYSRYFVSYFLKPNTKIDSNSLIEIHKNINLNKSKIGSILKTYKKILMCLNLKDITGLIENVELLINTNGVSIFLLRILQFVNNNLSNKISDFEYKGKIEIIYNKIRSQNINYINVAIKELTSDKNDYFSVCDRINLCEENVPTVIIKSFINQIPDSKSEYVKILNAFYSISILDATLYILYTSRLELPYTSIIDIDREIIKEYKPIQELDFNAMQFYNNKDQFCDLYFFRDSLLLLTMLLKRKRIVTHFHNSSFGHVVNNNKLLLFINRYIYNRVDRIII